METTEIKNKGRVREASTPKANREIDRKTMENIRQYGDLSDRQIRQRLSQLSREWDVEKTLEVNASSLALIGLALGRLVNKRWYILPGVVASFLLQHGLQGWCPPLPLFRKMGIRTRREIDEEKYALKISRGDFDNLSSTSSSAEIQKGIRK